MSAQAQARVPLRIPVVMDLRFRVSAGKFFGPMLEELRRTGRLAATRCPECRKVLFPPREVCGDCRCKMAEWVAVGPRGTVRAFTEGHYDLLDPVTGRPRPTPFVVALIQLDGADTFLNHYLHGVRAGQVRLGMRVRAVLRSERRGRILDILHFEPIASRSEAMGGTEGVPPTLEAASDSPPESFEPARPDRPLVVEVPVRLPFHYAAGGTAPFLEGLREKRILAGRCRNCGAVRVPIASFCAKCPGERPEAVEVGPGGTLRASAGDPGPLFGLIHLDGASNLFLHRLGGAEPEKFVPGARVEPVFAEERRSHILDIACFRPAGGEAPDPTPFDCGTRGSGARP